MCVCVCGGWGLVPQGSSGSPVARPRPLMPATAIASVSGRRPVVDVVLCCLLCGVCAEVAPAGPSYRGVIYDRPDHTRGDGLYACLGNPRCDMVANFAIFLSDGDPQFGRCAREGRRAVSFFCALPQSHSLCRLSSSLPIIRAEAGKILCWRHHHLANVYKVR